MTFSLSLAGLSGRRKTAFLVPMRQGGETFSLKPYSLDRAGKGAHRPLNRIRPYT